MLQRVFLVHVSWCAWAHIVLLGTYWETAKSRHFWPRHYSPVYPIFIGPNRVPKSSDTRWISHFSARVCQAQQPPRLFLVPYQCLSPPDSTGMLGRIIFAWWKGWVCLPGLATLPRRGSHLSHPWLYFQLLSPTSLHGKGDLAIISSEIITQSMWLPLAMKPQSHCYEHTRL